MKFSSNKREPRKMIKHVQTIRPQKPTNRLSVFDHFAGSVSLHRVVNVSVKVFSLNVFVEMRNSVPANIESNSPHFEKAQK